MAVSFRFAVRTHLGTVRTNNEDSALGSSQVLLLADGMGGHAAGEVASAVAMRVFSELVGTEHADVGREITLAGRSTRTALHQMSDADPILESMGTTLLAVVSHGDGVTVGHIGDSRVYALRDEALYQVTTDHTHVQRLVETGQLTPDKARTHPYRAMLLRSLDDQPNGPDLDLIDAHVILGDRLLLCSDGLSDYVSPEHIGSLLSTPDLQDAADALIEGALRVGTRDNVTVVVADVVDDGDVEADAAQQLVGSIIDDIHLSRDAREALTESLPFLVFPQGVDAPLAADTEPQPADAEPDPVDAPELPEPAEAAVISGEIEEVATEVTPVTEEAPGDPAEPDEPENPADPHEPGEPEDPADSTEPAGAPPADPGPPVDPAPAAAEPRQPRESWIPGILAGAFVLGLVIGLILIL